MNSKRERAAQLAIKAEKRQLEAAMRSRKGHLKDFKYPVDYIVALSEASLCDNRPWYAVYPAAKLQSERTRALEERQAKLGNKLCQGKFSGNTNQSYWRMTTARVVLWQRCGVTNNHGSSFRRWRLSGGCELRDDQDVHLVVQENTGADGL